MSGKQSANGHRLSGSLAAPGAMLRSRSERSGGGAGRIAVVLGRFEALVGRGLEQILGDDPRLCMIDSDLEDGAIEHAVVRWAPRVAILDEASAGAVAPSVLERLRLAQPATGIVVLAYRPVVAYSMRLFARGASCVAKSISTTDLLVAVHAVAKGARVFASDEGHLHEQRSPVTGVSLTPREIEVLEYLSRGRSHAQIAHELQLSGETIRTHSAHIRAKLGVRRSRDLIGLPVPEIR